MRNLTKLAASLATAAVLALPGMAQATVIDGINVGNGVLTFVSSTIMEERNQGTTHGGIITGNGQTLHGVGDVTQIFSDGVLVWSASATEELTFVFDNFVSTGFTPTAVGFTGGTVKFFHEKPVANQFNFGTANGFADGNLWLDLVGAQFNDVLHPVSCTNVTLCGTGTIQDPSGNVDINGGGVLNVTGLGLADAYFDTNNTLAFGHANADFQIGSNANNQFPTGFLFGTHGTASISNIRNVPEPGTVALLALGLLGIGIGRRVGGRAKKD